MKFSKMLAVGVMLVSGPMHMGWAWAETPKNNNAYISISQHADGGGKSCIVSAEKTATFYMGDTTCDNDEASYFQLNNVPSATKITFTSDKDCVGSSRWYYELTTIVHPTSSIWLSIPNLHSKMVGDIVVKGVRLTYKHGDGGSIKGKLSCVGIIRSLQP